MAKTYCQFLTDFQNSFTAESQVNFQQNPYNTFHHTFSMLPHYPAKFRSSGFGISEENADKNVTYFDF